MERRERDNRQETKLLSLSRRSITLINTQLIHQFAFRHADAVNLALLRAGITLYVKQQLNNLSSKLNVTVQPVFVSPKLEQQLKRHEIKPPIVNQQCIVYEFKCNLCDAGYVGYTHGHLHECVEGHTRKSSLIYKHCNLQQNSEMPEHFIEQFHIIAKCSGKFDGLIKEMLYIRMRKPTLNVQTDSIRTKVFV